MMFSVIVPIYNVESFLGKCLNSILSQDFDDFEVIAVNDGSTDGSAAILEEFSGKSDKMKVFHQSNMGLGATRNNAIKTARGEYLVFVDSDDYIRSDMLSVLYKHLNKFNLDILSFDCKTVDAEGNELSASNKNDKPEFIFLSKKEFLVKEPTVCTKVYRRSLFVDNNIFFPDRLWYEDLATVFRLVPHAEKIGYVNESLYYYVQQPGSITHSKFTTRMLEIIDSFDILLNHYKGNEFLEEYYNELEWNAILHVAYYSAFRLLNEKFRRNEMKKVFRYLETNFPYYKSNVYLNSDFGSRYMMEELLKKKFFEFYFKELFRRKKSKFYYVFYK